MKEKKSKQRFLTLLNHIMKGEGRPSITVESEQHFGRPQRGTNIPFLLLVTRYVRLKLPTQILITSPNRG